MDMGGGRHFISLLQFSAGKWLRNQDGGDWKNECKSRLSCLKNLTLECREINGVMWGFKHLQIQAQL